MTPLPALAFPANTQPRCGSLRIAAGRSMEPLQAVRVEQIHQIARAKAARLRLSERYEHGAARTRRGQERPGEAMSV